MERFNQSSKKVLSLVVKVQNTKSGTIPTLNFEVRETTGAFSTELGRGAFFGNFVEHWVPDWIQDDKACDNASDDYSPRIVLYFQIKCERSLTALISHLGFSEVKDRILTLFEGE